MNRRATFFAVLVLLATTLVLSERRKVEAPVGPDAILHFIADTQRELSRLPVRLTRLSDEEEIRIGNELATRYANWGELYEPEATEDARVVEAYLRQVGGRLAVHAHRKLPYQFHYIPDLWLVNAFAVPGGHVFMGAGLMALMDSEDQLAAVLAHEIEHIDQYHCAERVQLEARLRKLRLGVPGRLVTLPTQVFQAGYSKAQELEADREGTRLAVRASYSPVGALRLFETFNRFYEPPARRAQTPQEELSRVALETLEGYFRSHPPPPERIAQVQKMIADERWENASERNLAVDYIFWTERARRALDAKRYEEAAALARRALARAPGWWKSSRILGQAQFMLADFSTSAAAYRQYLEAVTWDITTARQYADALAALRQPQKSAQEFQDWMVRQTAQHELQVELAGLRLLAGDERQAEAALALLEAPAQSAEASQPQVQGRGTGITNPLADAATANPELIGRLGWWYYRAGNHPQAADLLTRAVQARPQNPELREQLGWSLVEQHNYEAALSRFETSAIGRAVAWWQARERDRALEAFDAVRSEPQWLNPRWVAALYSPLVAQSVQELETERQKRLAERLRTAAQR